jgi:TPR repeat protein
MEIFQNLLDKAELLRNRMRIQKFLIPAKFGSTKAQYRLGWEYENSVDYVERMYQNYTEAAKWYRKSAEQGYAKAQTALGELYENGRGVELNNIEAVKWHRLAAEQGYAQGQSRLGWMYALGRGVAQNNAEAEKWWRLAAEQGLAGTQWLLGVKYAEGDIVAQNGAEAVKWFKKAAKQGDMNSAEWLVIMYRGKLGVPQDVEEKKKWQRVADEMQDVQWDPTIPFWRNTLYELFIGFWKRIWIFRFKRRELSEY